MKALGLAGNSALVATESYDVNVYNNMIWNAGEDGIAIYSNSRQPGSVVNIMNNTIHTNKSK